MTLQRQAYDREMPAAAKQYYGNSLDKAFYHRARAYLGPIVHIRSCKSTLVDAEGRLETPRPNRDKRPTGQDYGGC